MKRYILYARKSQEDEGRQQQSIDDQVRIMTELAERHGLVIVQTLTEEKSAKEPYQRPVYDRTLQLIRDGQAEAILSYHANRLTRNMVEGGELQHLLTKGIIQEIRTYNEIFTSRDSILPFVLQTAMSTQFSLDLSQIVKRGLHSKAAKGDFIGRAPEGYRNDVYNGRIDIDPERYELIRKAWDLMLTGTYSVEGLLRVMTDEWGYRTRQTRKTGGKPLTKSGLHHILRNIFYTGIFMYAGELRQGNHRPMITFEEFEAVQRILSRRGTQRPKWRSFAFTGLITCATCGRQITAEFQRGHLKRGAYVYYRCTNHRVCRGPFVREERLEEQIVATLQSLAVRPSACQLAEQVIKRMYSVDMARAQLEAEQRQQALLAAEQRRSNLIRLRVDDLISDDELVTEKARLDDEVNSLRQAALRGKHSLDRARTGTEAVMKFALHAPLEFSNATTDRKKQIARTLGQSYRLLPDGQLQVEVHPLLAPLVLGSVEPRKTPDRTRSGAGLSASVLDSAGDRTKIEPLNQVWRLLFSGVVLPDSLAEPPASAKGDYKMAA